MVSEQVITSAAAPPNVSSISASLSATIPLFNFNHNISVTVPTRASQASLDPNWRQVMSDEYNALLDNQTWDLVPHHPLINFVGCKWVFQLKEKSDGSIERYKARLVAQGFKQQYLSSNLQPYT